MTSNYRVKSGLGFFFSYGDDGAGGRQKKKTLKRRSRFNKKVNIKRLPAVRKRTLSEGIANIRATVNLYLLVRLYMH